MYRNIVNQDTSRPVMACYDKDMSELTRHQYVHPLVRCPRCNTAYYHIGQVVDVVCDQCDGAAINALCFEDGISLALNETYQRLWDGGHYRALRFMLLSLREKIASQYWQSEINHRLRRVQDKLDVPLDLGELVEYPKGELLRHAVKCPCCNVEYYVGGRLNVVGERSANGSYHEAAFACSVCNGSYNDAVKAYRMVRLEMMGWEQTPPTQARIDYLLGVLNEELAWSVRWYVKTKKVVL